MSKFIWTNHALKRLDERKIPRNFIDQTLRFPDRSLRLEDNTIQLQKRIKGKMVAAIIKQNERKEHIIISCWINPPFSGTRDYRKRQRYLEKKHATFGRKVWLTFLDLIGL